MNKPGTSSRAHARAYARTSARTHTQQSERWLQPSLRRRSRNQRSAASKPHVFAPSRSVAAGGRSGKTPRGTRERSVLVRPPGSAASFLGSGHWPSACMPSPPIVAHGQRKRLAVPCGCTRVYYIHKGAIGFLRVSMGCFCMYRHQFPVYTG